MHRFMPLCRTSVPSCPMRIGIAGYGKMGRAVERIAQERRHETVVLQRHGEDYTLQPDIDCVIDFTHASATPLLIRQCICAGIPVVSGTTGWDAEQGEVFAFCKEKSGALLWSPNFSVGMHIVYELNRRLAQMMHSFPEYDVTILEAHHTEKKDKPSGTAIALAGQILSFLKRKTKWVLSNDPDTSDAEDPTLHIYAERTPDVKGIHRITYAGSHDVISLRHKALSRDAFAQGAVVAAEWLTEGRKGVFTFADVMEIPE